MGSLVPAAGFDASQCAEKLLRRDHPHGPIAEVGVEKALQPCAEDGDRLSRESVALKLEPFRGDRFEGLRSGAALRLAPGARVDPVGDELPRLIALLSCALECYVWIRAERNQFLAAVHAVLQAPQSAAWWSHQHEESALIEELVRLLDRLRRANSGLGENSNRLFFALFQILMVRRRTRRDTGEQVIGG